MTQGVLCSHVGYLQWAPNVTGEIMESIFSLTGDQTQSPGLKVLGPVVQSVVSLTSSLRVISLTVLADSIYNILIFFAEKM